MKTIRNNPEIHNKIIWFLLFLNPFLDVFTSFSNHYLGRSLYSVLAIKFIFLLYLFFLVIKTKHKKLLYFSLFGCFYFLLFLSVQYYLKGSSFLLLETQNLFRTFYFPFAFSFLYLLQKSEIFQVERKKLVQLLFVYLFFLIVPSLTGLGFASYAHSKSGNIGWFYSTNEIGAILAILGPFLLSSFSNRSWCYRIFMLAIYLLGIFVLGTKVPMLAFVITCFCFLAFLYYRFFLNKEWKKICFSTLATILCSILFVFCILQSSFYKNIQVHLNFLGIHQIQDLFTFHHIDHFIFSERLSFLSDTHEIYQTHSFPVKVIGMGIGDVYETSPVSMKTIEMDYFDIFYHYGIIGVCYFISPFFFFYKKNKYQTDEKISIFLILLLAFFSGHILNAPSVSVIVALILIPKKVEVKA